MTARPFQKDLDALPAEIARVRDIVIPAYRAAGESLAASFMGVDLARAEKAVREQDGIAAIGLLWDLQQCQVPQHAK